METLGETYSNKIFEDWDNHFRELISFKEQFGHCNVPILWEQNKGLAKWLSILRNSRHKLPNDLIARLRAIGFEFSAPPKTWDEHFAELEEFSKTKGHIYLPQDEPEYEELKAWIARQKLDKDYLPKEQYQKLEELGLDWDDTSLRNARWMGMYGKLKEFKERNGHCKVPQKYPEDPKLSNWVSVQRRMEAGGKLSADRRSKLLALGFVWSFQEIYANQWEHHFQLLLAFKERHGHCIVPGKNDKLAGWVDRQRTNKTKGKISKAREKKLNQIGFVWDFNEIKEQTWQEKYQQLKTFREKYGHCLVSVNSPKFKTLGHWVATQRNLEERGRLEIEKKKKLEELGFVWKKDVKPVFTAIYEDKWLAQFRKLKDYKRKHGTCQVSLKIDPALQRWTSLQRRQEALGKLSARRIKKLNEIGFPWDINKSYWTKMYRALLQFHQIHGHTRVPWGWEQNPHLAPWAQRLKKDKKKLDKSKVMLLDAINFDWSYEKRNIIPWEGMYQRLVQFKQKHGHTRVPVLWSEDAKLGKWVSRMRYQRATLNFQRAALLDSIGFDWGNKSIAA